MRVEWGKEDVSTTYQMEGGFVFRFIEQREVHKLINSIPLNRSLLQTLCM